MVNLFRALLPLLFFLLASAPRSAHAASLEIEVAPSEGSLDEVFVMTVVVEGATQLDRFPFLKGGDKFRLNYRGPQQSTYISGTTVRHRFGFVYELLPKEPGLLETPSAELSIAGTVYRAQGKKVRVHDRSPTDRGNAPSYLLRQSVSKRRVFVGEQVLHTTELLAAVPLRSIQIEDESPEGFWQGEASPQARGSRFLNGKSYNTLVRERPLFPLRTGTIEIPGRQFSAKMLQPGRVPAPFSMFGGGLFDDLFDGAGSPFGRVVPVQGTSNPLSLEVAPLPPAPATPLQSVIPVGATSLDTTIRPHNVEVGHAVPFEITIVSEGNLNPLRLDLPNDRRVKLYDDGALLSYSPTAGGKSRMTKRFRFTAVPVQPGEYAIAFPPLVWFDPERGEYRSLIIPSLVLHVTGQPSGKPETARSPETDEALPSDAEIDSADRDSNGERTFSAMFAGMGRVAWRAMPPVVVLLLLVMSAAHLVRGVRLRRALRTPIRAATSARELREALDVALRASFGLDGDGELRRTVLESDAPDALKLEIVTLLDELDAIVWAPSPSVRLDDVRTRAIVLLRQIRRR